jgi:hypothetical protein
LLEIHAQAVESTGEREDEDEIPQGPAQNPRIPGRER